MEVVLNIVLTLLFSLVVAGVCFLSRNFPPSFRPTWRRCTLPKKS